MRELTLEEMSHVAGGRWWHELEAFFSDLFEKIFFGDNDSNNTPTISQETYNNFINACYRAGGTSSITVTTASGDASVVRVLDGSGNYTTVSLKCDR